MANEFILIKGANGVFYPATDSDKEATSSWKQGQGVRVGTVKLKPRSLQYHKLYWGGLLRLAVDYWEPTGGLVSKQEESIILKFSQWLSAQHGQEGILDEATSIYLQSLEQSRSERIETPDKSIQELHRWVKEKAGYYDLVMTPDGIRKEVKSINFNAMGSDEFDAFYKRAFSACWRFILSRNFESEAELQNVIDNLSAMG